MRRNFTASLAAIATMSLALAAVIAPSSAAADAPPFAATSVWNAPLAPSAPIGANSAALVTELQRQVTTYGTWINTNQYSTPVYIVPADQPLVYVTLSVFSPTLQTAFASVPLPANAVPARGSDQHLVVWQPSTDSMWEFWKLADTATGWTARWGGAMTSVSTNPGYFPATQGATSTSLPLLGGLMRISELQSGQINHALALAIPETMAGSFVSPAQRTDGNYSGPSAIPEGTRFRIDHSVDLTKLGLPSAALAMAQAVQKYGMIVRDQAGAVDFYGEDPTPTGSNPYPALFHNQYPDTVLAKFPWGSLQVVTPGS
jgi:hypothetical protein